MAALGKRGSKDRETEICSCFVVREARDDGGDGVIEFFGGSEENRQAAVEKVKQMVNIAVPKETNEVTPPCCCPTLFGMTPPAAPHLLGKLCGTRRNYVSSTPFLLPLFGFGLCFRIAFPAVRSPAVATVMPEKS